MCTFLEVDSLSLLAFKSHSLFFLIPLLGLLDLPAVFFLYLLSPYHLLPQTMTPGGQTVVNRMSQTPSLPTALAVPRNYPSR